MMAAMMVPMMAPAPVGSWNNPENKTGCKRDWTARFANTRQELRFVLEAGVCWRFLQVDKKTDHKNIWPLQVEATGQTDVLFWSGPQIYSFYRSTDWKSPVAVEPPGVIFSMLIQWLLLFKWPDSSWPRQPCWFWSASFGSGLFRRLSKRCFPSVQAVFDAISWNQMETADLLRNYDHVTIPIWLLRVIRWLYCQIWFKQTEKKHVSVSVA